VIKIAKFRFKHAVMNAGKSQELIRTHYNYKVKNQNVLVLTPSIDNRNGIGIISSRTGDKINANSVMPGTMRSWLTNYFDNNEEDVICILIDETQFFIKDDILAIKELAVLTKDIPVIAYGLKVDFKGELFEGSAAAIAIAEEINEIETVCAFCNSKSIMNLRFDNKGQPVREGDQIQIGDSEYKPVCHKHYIDDNVRIIV